MLPDPEAIREASALSLAHPFRLKLVAEVFGNGPEVLDRQKTVSHRLLRAVIRCGRHGRIKMLPSWAVRIETGCGLLRTHGRVAARRPQAS